MRNVVVDIGVVAVVLISSVAFGQVAAATDVTKEDYLAVKNAPEGGVDRQVKVVDIGQ